MKRGSKYEELIKELPWEDGGRYMAPSIVAAAGIPVNKSVPEPDKIHQAFNWQVLQALTCLGLLLLISVYGFGWPNPRPLASERMGTNAISMWTQAADGFTATLGKYFREPSEYLL